MHNYSNVTCSHICILYNVYALYYAKCLVFKSAIWKSVQEQTDGLQCQPMCGNVCVIYGQPISKMCSGKRLVVFIYELIAIISKTYQQHTKQQNFEFKASAYANYKKKLLQKMDIGNKKTRCFNRILFTYSLYSLLDRCDMNLPILQSPYTV